VIEGLLRQDIAALGITLEDGKVNTLVNFVELILKWNRILNLVGSSSPDYLVRNHIVDCLIVAPYLGCNHLVDVGSGAGFPGMVIAICNRRTKVSLVESSARKSRFLSQVAIELRLPNVEVVTERIERWHPEHEIDCIVCRGYGSLRRFYDDTRALHNDGCRLVAMKGALSDAELADLRSVSTATSVQMLDTPWWDHRQLVIIDVGA
tara:strand:- start:927 stop:1547 length:621 start_codon:yes stop_codon:yes gene_type:complete